MSKYSSPCFIAKPDVNFNISALSFAHFTKYLSHCLGIDIAHFNEFQ